jgi:cytochrome c nitrite reductase small subunit
MLHHLGITWQGAALTLAAGTAFGLSACTFWYAQGLSYFSSSPSACANCHIMHEQHDGWLRSSHHAVATCNDCHVPHGFLGKWLSKASNGFWHSKHFTLDDFHEPIRIKPYNGAALQENCIHCHSTAVHDIVHLGSAGDPSNACVRCHANVGHGASR